MLKSNKKNTVIPVHRWLEPFYLLVVGLFFLINKITYCITIATNIHTIEVDRTSVHICGLDKVTVSMNVETIYTLIIM